MKDGKLKMKKVVRNKVKYVNVKRLECGRYDVYFDFIKVPVRMSLAYLASLVNNNHIAVKKVLRT